MEMWERVTVAEHQHQHQHRHRRNSPSFSSSLLDSIYRSIDAPSGNATAGNPTPCAVTRLNYNYYDSASAKLAPPAPILTRSNPTRPDSPPQSDPNPSRNQNQINKKLRDLKKKKKSGSPFSSSSPGAKLAGFLNSLFTASSSQKKPKVSSSPSPSPPSTSRSCLVKTPSSSRGSSNGSARSARSVRFCPVGVIVGEDCRPCGEKLVVLDDDDGEAMARERRRRRRMVMEEVILRGFEMESESDDDSEDLFELRDLGGTDELPVYGTTDLGINSGGLLL